MADVFISYNREDQNRARAIAGALEAEGLSVWWDSNLRAGQSYDEVTEKNLREAGAVVVLWSKRSVNSKWVRAEATIGERCSTLVPAMIDECDRPLRFELVQTADLINWRGDRNDANWRAFVHDIQAAIGHHGSAAPQQSATGSPAADVTIENTFWTSIKDGGDAHDFEAYLKRYPNGHFADLAKNRLVALARAAAPAPPPRPAPAAAAPQPRPQPQPQVQQQAAPRQSAPQRAQAPAPQKSGPNVAVIAAVVLGAILIGGGAFFAITRGAPGAKKQEEVAATATAPAQEAVTESAPTPAEEAALAAEITAAPEAQDSLAALDAADGEAVEGVIEPAEGEAVEAAPAEETLAAAPESETAAEVAPSTDQPAAAEGTFRDCDFCPVMAKLPGGAYLMGSPKDEPGRFAYEGPQHEVTLKPFAMGVHEVTFDEWAACVDDGGCRNYAPADAGFGRGARPAIYISWADAKAYVQWLSKKSGRKYRLPTESEWEYAARGGAATAYWWGARFDRSMAPSGKTSEAGSYSANAFGLYDMLGNASEWVEDCYVNNFTAAPTDGAPVLNGDCGQRVVRGGSWKSDAGDMRIANRRRITTNVRDSSLGFRVAADL